jgi:hypothetical protein
VGVLRAKPVLPDPQRAKRQIEIRPPESEHFALTQAEHERDGPSGAVPALRSSGKDLLNLVQLVRLNLLVLHARRLGQRDGIPADVTTPDCLAERGLGRPVDLVSVAGLVPSRLHLGVELLEVVRLNAFEPVLAKSGNEVVVDRIPVRVGRRVADGRRRDVLDPVDEPLLHGPGRASLAHGPGVALLLQCRRWAHEVPKVCEQTTPREKLVRMYFDDSSDPRGVYPRDVCPPCADHITFARTRGGERLTVDPGERS